MSTIVKAAQRRLCAGAHLLKLGTPLNVFFTFSKFLNLLT